MKRSSSVTAAAARVVVSSSPGRAAEKLPTAPGMSRLLRGKSGSRSRSRGSVARSSPMFVSRSRSTGPSAAAEAGEPSSPKVTCIGQVRIRNKKSKSKPAISKKSKADYHQQDQQQKNRPMMRCHCLERSLLCKFFRRNPSSDRPRRSLWWRWILSLRSEGESSYRQRKSLGEEADLAYPPPEGAARGTESDRDGGESEETEEEEEEEGETRVFMSSAITTPPKNALLLMRCRSAPHNRSSSLATRFAVSPLPVPETSAVEESEKVGGEELRGSSKDVRDEAEAGYYVSSPSYRPLVLTRCKSEPAKTAEKLVVPEEATAYGILNNSISGGGGGGKQRRFVQEDGLPSQLPPHH